MGLVHIAAVLAGASSRLMQIHTHAVDNSNGGRMSTASHKSVDEMGHKVSAAYFAKFEATCCECCSIIIKMKYVNVRKTTTKRGIRSQRCFFTRRLLHSIAPYNPPIHDQLWMTASLRRFTTTSIVPTGPTRHYTTSVHDGLSTSIETLCVFPTQPSSHKTCDQPIPVSSI